MATTLAPATQRDGIRTGEDASDDTTEEHQVSKPKAKQDEYGGLAEGPVFTPRFVIALRADGGRHRLDRLLLRRRCGSTRPAVPAPEPGGPAVHGRPRQLELHDRLRPASCSGSRSRPTRRTPLGRGRGVVVGMLGCFLIGLLWICTYYVVSDDPSAIPVMNDLGQYNLMLGIAFMAVGFTFATRWE